MRVLITGGFGYLGGRCAQFLASQPGFEIILGSRQLKTAPAWLPQVNVVQTEWDSLVKLEQICVGVDAVIHMAGMNAQDCAADPVAAFECNAMATENLLNAAIHQKVKRFIYLSTAHVYGSPLTGKITEETPAVNLHPYATSHLAGEAVVLVAQQRHEIEGVVIRLSNAFGAPTHKEVNCWMLLVNDLCRQAVTSQKMVLNSSGLQSRDFISLIDTCRAVNHLLKLPTDKLGNGVFNVGSGRSLTILEMTKKVAERVLVITGNKPEIFYKTDSNTEVFEVLDYRITKLLATGFCLNYASDEEEIGKLIQFCRENIV